MGIFFIEWDFATIYWKEFRAMEFNVRGQSFYENRWGLRPGQQRSARRRVHGPRLNNVLASTMNAWIIVFMEIYLNKDLVSIQAFIKKYNVQAEVLEDLPAQTVVVLQPPSRCNSHSAP